MSNSEEQVPVETERTRSWRTWQDRLGSWCGIAAGLISAYSIYAGERSGAGLLVVTAVTFIAGVVSLLHEHNSARQHITSTYEAVFRTIDKSKPNTRTRTATTTAIDAVAHQIHGNRTGASIVLIAALFVVLLLNLRWPHVAPEGLLILLIAAIVVLNASTLALDYRVSHGLFGTNEYEAREIVRFVLKNAGDTDFSGGLGARDLDLSAATATTLDGVWSGAPAYE
jgi:hypothetical protein